MVAQGKPSKFSHNPVGLIDDRLNYARYAEQIYELLRDTKPEDVGRTIVIWGEWGIGKSSLLKITAEKLTAEKLTETRRKWRVLRFISPSNLKMAISALWAKKNDQRQHHAIPTYKPIVVQFNAWKYEQTPQTLLSGLLEQTFKTIDEQLRLIDALHLRAILIFKRIRRQQFSIFWLSIWATVLVGGLSFYLFLLASQAIAPPLLNANNQIFWEILLALLTGASLTGGLGALIFLLRAAFGLFRQAFTQIPLQLAGLVMRPRLKTENYPDWALFQKDLDDLLKVISRPVVILLDDLDRCKPDQIVPVFEMMKYFDVSSHEFSHSRYKHNFARIAFVLAMDYRAIRDALRVHFKDHIQHEQDKSRERLDAFVRQYIEKIIQTPIFLPPLSESGAHTYLDESFVDAGISQAAKSILLAGLEQPRAIGQICNTYLALDALLPRVEIDSIRHTRLVALLARLQYEWPDLYRGIVRNPYLLFFLHGFVTGSPNDICDQTLINEFGHLELPPDIQDRDGLLEALNSRRMNLLLKAANDLFMPEKYQITPDVLTKFLYNETFIKTNWGQQYRFGDALPGGNPAYVYALANASGSSATFESLVGYLQNLDADDNTAALERVLFSTGIAAQATTFVVNDALFESVTQHFTAISRRLQWRAFYAAWRIALRFVSESQQGHKIYNLYCLVGAIEPIKTKLQEWLRESDLKLQTTVAKWFATFDTETSRLDFLKESAAAAEFVLLFSETSTAWEFPEEYWQILLTLAQTHESRFQADAQLRLLISLPVAQNAAIAESLLEQMQAAENLSVDAWEGIVRIQNELKNWQEHFWHAQLKRAVKQDDRTIIGYLSSAGRQKEAAAYDFIQNQITHPEMPEAWQRALKDLAAKFMMPREHGAPPSG